MNVAQILEWLQSKAPLETAADFDNVGLLMGETDCEVTGVLFALDLTSAVLERAVELKANLIITHHPFLFHAIKRVDYASPQGKLFSGLSANHMNVIAMHTNWDQAQAGVSDTLARILGLQNLVRVDDFLRIGTLSSPVTAAAFSDTISEALGLSPRMYGNASCYVQKIAVAGGGYGEAEALAASAGADAYVVGEIRHHDILDACERGMVIYDSGHYATEFPGLVSLYSAFSAAAKDGTWPVQAFLHSVVPFEGALNRTNCDHKEAITHGTN